ncbi:two component, sigma54 specific, transcriptional regulator, Fis family [Denitrovibrio acetiphilus DSM 12809]|uniref:Two component, sigma54 specific, transcriptional regulator, Fis family n=1 Tax=Denitrovibrio acetiphilus (strain DSM 12809 / NBRC 114555 / N2460) TaxID=522772 RepID=D4H5R3_DENA2|nr:sigma-54 dependent transcriptional regulator [Denitrovibrio acetiphilus]ADD69504.1 two component, sigma54 specific, transcriptional regulator, Fis family [Denitrovibrio acetiphilus DSM 12809]
MKILIVDDEKNHRMMLKLHLEDAGHKTAQAENGLKALEALDEGRFDVILLDMKMDVMDGLTFLGMMNRKGHSVPVIVITAFSTVKTAVESMKLGAVDYLTKPVDIPQLMDALEKINEQSGDVLTPVENYRFGGVYTQEGLGSIIEQLKLVAPTDATVLILGESGTGKEIVARSIHDNSKRAQRPYLAINCAALSENIIESELFGHVKGAFTTAVKDNKGLFEAADGGTLFLDEIGELSLNVQAKLLRVLQEGAFERVGDTRTLKTNVRIVAATNRNLKKLSEKGDFREDLYFRLAVFPVEVPPLRERKEEIAPLVKFFIDKHAEKLGKLIKSADPAYIRKLSDYGFPGNIRELENIVERSIILTTGTKLEPVTLPAFGTERDGGLSIRGNERDLIIKALKKTGGNKTKAAEILQISRRTLHNKLKEFDLED